MARRISDDDKLTMDFLDPEDKDYSVLLAEADKIRADAAVAVRKHQLLLDTEALTQQANDIFRRSLVGATG